MPKPKGVRKPPSTWHRKVADAILAAPHSGTVEVVVTHGPDCASLAGKRCDCNPDVTTRTVPKSAKEDRS